MKTIEYSMRIIKELEQTLSSIDDKQCDEIVERMLNAKRIYVAGGGRSQLMIRAFAMRLMHVGFAVHVVGDTVTPAIEAGDLLIIGSGSGETGNLVNVAVKAKKLGVQIGLITIFPESTLGKMADTVIHINASTSKAPTEFTSIQPGGASFEQSMMLLCDSLIVRIAEVRQIDANKGIKLRHANLE